MTAFHLKEFHVICGRYIIVHCGACGPVAVLWLCESHSARVMSAGIRLDDFKHVYAYSYVYAHACASGVAYA